MGEDGFPVLGDLSSFTTAQLRQYAADTGVKVGRSRQAQIDHLTVAIQSAE
jgi:hypothetical protein